MLAGCAHDGATSVPIFGAYFPLWLLSGIAGVVAAIVLRVVFVVVGLDAILLFRLSVYISIALLCGAAVYFWFLS
ncbi:hypothetical protein GCM10008170_03530 [Methylopila capsulata]|uniref:Uncharacterized protein n=1 Tax=Methylopila capsulata TaxID=61654 RepID=A0A9W6IRQ0_9HYPH|nr:hypothetical protein GCM10008170_03530 [Methylopila capsulata]